MKRAGFLVKGTDNGLSYKALHSRFLHSVHCLVIQTEHKMSRTDLFSSSGENVEPYLFSFISQREPVSVTRPVINIGFY